MHALPIDGRSVGENAGEKFSFFVLYGRVTFFVLLILTSAALACKHAMPTKDARL